MKKILLVLSLLLLTGCNIKYDLVITDKEEIKEKIYVYVDNEIIRNNSMEIEEYLDYYTNLYGENIKYKDFNITAKKGKTVSYFLATNKYHSLDDYITSYSFKTMFDSALIERIGKYTSFTTSTNVFLKNIENDELLSDESKNNNYEINIKFYNKVANHNADEVDEKNNIYTWNVNKDTDKDYIYFKIGPDVRYDVIIKDYIQNNILTISIIGGAILLLSIVVLYMYINIKKNNEI